jgi:outer membrane autotransporter protein
VKAHNVTIDNARLEIGAAGSAYRLDLGIGTLTFSGGTITLVAPVVDSGQALPVLASGSVAGDIPAFGVTAHYSDGLVLSRDGNLYVVPLSSDFDPYREISLTLDAMIAAMTAVHNRVNESFLLPIIEQSPKRNGLWAKGIASFADYDDRGGHPGHSEDTYGIVVGYDALTPSRDYMIGVYAGITYSSIDTDRGSSSDLDQEFIGVYGAGKWGRFYTGLNAMAGWSSSDNTRVEASGNATSENGANYMGGSAEAGMLFQPTGKLRVQPSIAVHYLRADIDGYREYGPGAVRVPGYSEDVWQSLVAVRAFQQFTMPWGWASIADVSFGWRQNLTSTDSEIQVSFIDSPILLSPISSGGYTRSGAVIGVGLRSTVSKTSTLGLGYDFEIASGRSRHSFNAIMRWVW